MDDPHHVRECKAWYKAGAGALAVYTGIGIMLIACAMGLVCTIWTVDGNSAAITTAMACLVWVVAANGIVILQALQVARRGGIEVDRF